MPGTAIFDGQASKDGNPGGDNGNNNGDEMDTLTGTVTIDKTSPKIGDTLTATYTDGNGSGVASCQWLRDDNLISGATGKTYTVVASDAGMTFKAQVGYAGQSGNSSPYSDIELYLMGMKSAAELKGKDFTLDVYTGTSYKDLDNLWKDGYFYAEDKKSYTIDQLIALNGERIPSAADSQKEFKVLTVLVSENGNSQNDYDGLVNDIKWFANMSGTKPGLYNFSQATDGIGSLVVTGLTSSLKK